MAEAVRPPWLEWGLVDDDCEVASALLVADLVEDEWELLHRRDDDLLAGLDEPAQIARALCVPDRRADLGVLLDRVPNLPVEDAPVRDHDDGVEDRDVVLRESDKLVCEPRDGVALAAACGVLDEVAVPGAAGAGVGEQVPHRVDLVVARPDLGLLPLAGLLVLRLHDLGVVLEDIGQALAGQHLAPQVVGLEPVGVGRVARAVVPAAVEGQEPRCLALEVRAEANVVFVDREVRDAAAELEELLAGVAVFLVLLDGVAHGLLRQVVLQLKGEDR